MGKCSGLSKQFPKFPEEPFIYDTKAWNQRFNFNLLSHCAKQAEIAANLKYAQMCISPALFQAGLGAANATCGVTADDVERFVKEWKHEVPIFLGREERKYYVAPEVGITADGENRDITFRLFYFTPHTPDLLGPKNQFELQVAVEKIPTEQVPGEPVRLFVPGPEQYAQPYDGEFGRCQFYGYSLEPGKTLEVTFPASESTFWFRRVIYRLRSDVAEVGAEFERSVFPFGRLAARTPELVLSGAPGTTVSSVVTLRNGLATEGSLDYSDIVGITQWP